MLIVETIRKVRCAYYRDKKSIRQIARDFRMSRTTVRKVIRSDETEFTYDQKDQPMPKLAQYADLLSGYLEDDDTKSYREQRTAILLFEDLQRQGVVFRVELA